MSRVHPLRAPIDDNTDELFRLEPVGPEQRGDVVAALRNEATRLQGASFEDRIGVPGGADRKAIVAAHQNLGTANAIERRT
jgi:hypothetical protein